MAKRSKRVEKGIESLKKQIEEHFAKLEKNMNENEVISVRYYIKEIDKSLITTLEYKISLLGVSAEHSGLIKRYRNLLKEYKKKLDAA